MKKSSVQQNSFKGLVVPNEWNERTGKATGFVLATNGEKEYQITPNEDLDLNNYVRKKVTIKGTLSFNTNSNPKIPSIILNEINIAS